MDHVLGTGPGFTNRISRRLRDELGLAYSVHAAIHSSAGDPARHVPAYIGTSPEHVATALAGFRSRDPAHPARARRAGRAPDGHRLRRRLLRGSRADDVVFRASELGLAHGLALDAADLRAGNRSSPWPTCSGDVPM